MSPSPTAFESAGTSSPPDATPGGSGIATDALTEVCAKGAEEGRVVYWGSFDETMNSMIEEFQKVHPGIEVETLTFPSDEAVTRTLTEVATGRPPEQDVQEGSMPIWTAWFERDLIATDIDWEALGVPADRVNSANVPRINRGAYGLAFNTNLLEAGDLPDSYDDLLNNEAFRELRLSVDPRGRPFNTLAILWGKERTLEYVQELKNAFNPLIIQGETANLTAVAGGEVEISTSGRNGEILEQQAIGAPIDSKYLDAIVMVDNYNVVLADAQHPNAARCWAAWYSSPAADPWLLEYRLKTNVTIPPGVPEGVEIVASETAEDIALEAEVAEELGAILTGD